MSYFGLRHEGHLRATIAGACARLGLKRVRQGSHFRSGGAALPRYSWYRAEKGWREFCESIIDSMFAFELREQELKDLLGPRTRKR